MNFFIIRVKSLNIDQYINNRVQLNYIVMVHKVYKHGTAYYNKKNHIVGIFMFVILISCKISQPESYQWKKINPIMFWLLIGYFWDFSL